MSLTRNPAATRRRLVAAIGTLIARSGVAALGVNAVAAEAGVDKVLIYRYFGGLDGLMQAYGREVSLWPGLEDVAGTEGDWGGPADFSEALARVLTGFYRALRARPVTLELLASEAVERNPLTLALGSARVGLEAAVSRTILSGLRAPAHVDLEAIIAVLVAGVTYLAVRAHRHDRFAGLALHDGEDVARLEGAVARLVAGALADDEGGGSGCRT